MNIYIPIEIKSRDLESRLLVALVAAEAGHQVLVGDKPTTTGAALRGLLPPGVLHDKSLTPKAERLEKYRKLVDRGYVVTSQDEESGILTESYERFGNRRFSEESVALANRVFCWGRHDCRWISETYPREKEKIRSTGSPRLDMARPELSSYFPRPHRRSERPYILVPSNFGACLNRERLWERAAKIRATHSTPDKEKPGPDYFRRIAWQTEIIGLFVQAIHELSDRFPGVDIVVRPHPVEDPDAWENLLMDVPNISVEYEGSAGAYIRHATAIMHNGCTTAIEGMVAGVPGIAYRPVTSEYEMYLPNRMSWQATSLDDLTGLVREILDGSVEGERHVFSEASRAIASDRIENIEGSFAADRIVAEWGEMDHPDLCEQPAWEHLHRRLVAECAKASVRGWTSGGRKRGWNRWKIPGLNFQEAKTMVRRFQGALGRFEHVEIRRVGGRGFRLERGRH